MVARVPVKDKVVGSNPTAGAKEYGTNLRFSEKVGFSFFESDCSVLPRRRGVEVACSPKYAGFWLEKKEILMLSGE